MLLLLDDVRVDTRVDKEAIFLMVLVALPVVLTDKKAPTVILLMLLFDVGG